MVLKKYNDEIDLVRLELAIPRKDGIYFLEEMQKNEIKKDIIKKVLK